ncbi:MAG: hypothetical protein ABJ387_03155 [Balneola sp.]
MEDIVNEIDTLPQSSVGAPIPFVIASESYVVLFYYLQNTPPDWDGQYVKVVGSNTRGEPLAIITFKICYAHFFGPPNDESFSGHPLASKGLGPYSVYEIDNSSWIKEFERRNSVHPYHNTEKFLLDKRHFIFSFHDTTFECIAKDFEIETKVGSINEAVRIKFNELSES